MILIITVFLKRDLKYPIYDHDILNALTESVDYFNVMVYDYIKNDYNAPLEWAKNALIHMQLNAEVDPFQILLGIPFYGYKFEGANPVPVMGKDFIAFLKQFDKARFVWNQESHEHSVVSEGYTETVYKTNAIIYPSLYVRISDNISSLKRG